MPRYLARRFLGSLLIHLAAAVPVRVSAPVAGG